MRTEVSLADIEAVEAEISALKAKRAAMLKRCPEVRKRHGRSGAKNSRAKLSPAQVLRIRRDPRRSVEIAADYGIANGYVWKLKNGKKWAHLADAT